MSKNIKILLGIATLVPVLYGIYLIGYLLFFMISMVTGNLTDFFPSFLITYLNIFRLWILVMAIIYGFHAYKSQLTQGQKQLWYVLLILSIIIAPFAIVVLPLYWHKNIWQEPLKAATNNIKPAS